MKTTTGMLLYTVLVQISLWSAGPRVGIKNVQEEEIKREALNFQLIKYRFKKNK